MADRPVRVVTQRQLNEGFVLGWGDRVVQRPYVVADNLPDGLFLVEEPETEIDERRRLESE